MQTISIRTTQNVFIHYPIASIGDRILAHLLDQLILFIYTVMVIIAFVAIETDPGWTLILLIGVPWFFFKLIFEIFMNGQTPGKRALQIKVARLDGTQPTIGNYFLRWIFGLVDLYVMGGALALIVMAANGKGQRLGDIVAGTTVVKLIPSNEITANEVFISPENTYTPTFVQAEQLNAKDIELIQRALEANRNFANPQPVLVLAEKIKGLLSIQSNLPPAEFLYTLVKDYNHLTSR